MLDFGNFPRDQNIVYETFTTPGSWLTWNKPRNSIMVDMLVVGAGGGGGGGKNPSSATNFGATGGGGGAVASILVPASYLPDTLYIYVGLGGEGGNTSFSTPFGSTGEATVISTNPATFSNTVVSSPGGAGGNYGGYTGGAAGPTLGCGNTALPNLYSIGYAGISNLAQGPGSSNLTVSVYTPQDKYYEDYNSLTCPGAAGGSGTSNRGAYIVSRQQGVPTVTAEGYSWFKPLILLGGAGGNSSSSTSTSGTFGKLGGLGCGGGGGGIGGGVSGTPGGGGRGGDGFVIIKSW